jgi:hypothetical protein
MTGELVDAADSSQPDELQVLKEILKWTKVTSIPHVKKLLQETLATDEEKLAYHLSTGSTSREIAPKAGVSFQTIADWWDKWNRLGIAERMSSKGGGRGVRSFDLNDFGIAIPKLAAKAQKSQKSERSEGGSP